MRKLVLLGILAGVAAGTALSAIPAAARPPVANGQIAFARATCTSICIWELVAANPDGSHETLLAGPYPRDAWDDHFIANWSPDGNSVVFMANQKLWQANADGSGPHQLFEPPAGTGVDDGPTFTPDGKHIVFTRCCPQGYGYSLWRINSDGSGLQDVTNEPIVNGDGPADTTPQVSPDGRRIVFNRCFPNQPCQVTTVSITGKQMRRVTPPGMLVSTTGNWSPQDNEIVFSAHAADDVHSSLWVIRASGSGLRQIRVQGLACGGANADPNGIGCTTPRWSPDGKTVIFAASSSTNGSDIYTVNSDGSGLVQVTQGGASDTPTWGTNRPTR